MLLWYMLISSNLQKETSCLVPCQFASLPRRPPYSQPRSQDPRGTRHSDQDFFTLLMKTLRLGVFQLILQLTQQKTSVNRCLGPGLRILVLTGGSASVLFWKHMEGNPFSCLFCFKFLQSRHFKCHLTLQYTMLLPDIVITDLGLKEIHTLDW